jgi:hypothetical protein
MLLLTNSQELERQHEEVTSLRRSRDDSSVARNVDVEHRPACDKSPMDGDESCCLSDVPDAVGDRPNAA